MNRYLIEDIGNIYQNIANSESQVLNEESEYYDEELSELVEDIFSKISISMIYEGYSAEGVISFLVNSEEDIIIQEYLNFDHRVIVEGKVSEDYVLEQLEIFDFAISEGLGTLVGKAASGIGKLFAKRVPGTVLRTAGPLSSNAATKLAMKSDPTLFTKAKVGLERAIGLKGRKAVQAVKDAAKGAATALTSPTAKKIAVGSLLAGAGVLTGYLGSGNGGSPKVGPKLVGPKLVGPKLVGPKLVGPKAPVLPPPSGNGGGGSGGGANSSSGSGNSPSQKAPAKLPTTTKPPYIGKTPGGTEYERRAATLPELEAAQAKRAAGGSEEEAIKAGVDAGKETFYADKKELEPITSFTKSSNPEKKKPSTESTNEAYDLVLEYLISTNQVDTVEEAHYVMMQLDSENIGTIVEYMGG